MRQQKHKKWKRKRTEPYRQMKVKYYQQKMGAILSMRHFIQFMVSTKHKSRTETQNIKKEETEKNITENHQAKMAEKHKEKKKKGDVEQPENKR